MNGEMYPGILEENHNNRISQELEMLTLLITILPHGTTTKIRQREDVVRISRGP